MEHSGIVAVGATLLVKIYKMRFADRACIS